MSGKTLCTYIKKSINQLENANKAIKELIENEQKNVLKPPLRNWTRERSIMKRAQNPQMMISLFLMLVNFLIRFILRGVMTQHFDYKRNLAQISDF